MDHEAFMHTFINMIKAAMASEETNEFAHTTLLFCAKFFVSYTGDDTHLLLKEVFNWLTEVKIFNKFVFHTDNNFDLFIRQLVQVRIFDIDYANLLI